MHIEVVQRLFGIVDSSKWDLLPEVFHPGVVYERPGYEALTGLDAVVDFYKNTRIIKSGKHQLVDCLEQGDLAACHGRFIGLSRQDEKLDEQFADFYTFENGLIRLRRSYFFRPAI